MTVGIHRVIAQSLLSTVRQWTVRVYAEYDGTLLRSVDIAFVWCFRLCSLLTYSVLYCTVLLNFNAVSITLFRMHLIAVIAASWHSYTVHSALLYFLHYQLS